MGAGSFRTSRRARGTGEAQTEGPPPLRRRPAAAPDQSVDRPAHSPLFRTPIELPQAAAPPHLLLRARPGGSPPPPLTRPDPAAAIDGSPSTTFSGGGHARNARGVPASISLDHVVFPPVASLPRPPPRCPRADVRPVPPPAARPPDRHHPRRPRGTTMVFQHTPAAPDPGSTWAVRHGIPCEPPARRPLRRRRSGRVRAPAGTGSARTG